jgi:hypothetical protein
MSNIDSIFSDTIGIQTPTTSNSNLGIIDVVVPLPNLGVEREPLLPNIVNPITSPVVSTPINTLAPPKKSTDTSPTAGQPTIVQPTIVYNPPKVQEAPKEEVKVEPTPTPTKVETTTKPLTTIPKKKLSSQNMTFISVGLIAVGGILFFLARK